MRPAPFLLWFPAFVWATIAWAGEVPVFNLAADDVPKVVLLVSKPDRIILEVTYSKPRQAELRRLTDKNLPATIAVTLAGNPAGTRTFTAPSRGHSLKFAQPSLEAAFALAEALTFPASAPVALPPSTSQTGAARLPAIAPADVAKVELFIYKPPRVYLEVTRSPQAPASPEAVRLDMPSLAAAFAQTRFLASSLLSPAPSSLAPSPTPRS